MATFPQTVLGAKVGLQLTTDGPWTDITTYALQRDGTRPPIRITRGKPNERATYAPSRCDMQWNNRDGRFSPRNPTGPYYGQLGRNTPVRVSVPDQAVYLRFEDDAGSCVTAPDTSGLEIVGDIDIRIDFQPSNYQTCMLAYKWGTTAATQAWQIYFNGDGTLGFTWGDATAQHKFQSSLPMPNLGRIALRFTLAVATGTMTFWTAPTMAGTWTQLGTQFVFGATAVAGAVGQQVVIGRNGNSTTDPGSRGVQGKVYEFQLYSGIGGTLKADPVFTSQAEGATSFADGQGNTWTLNAVGLGTAELSERSYRYHGEAASLPQSWDVSGRDVWTPVTAAGILRRKGQGNAPLMSPIRRGIENLSGTFAPLVYWPCEDAAGASQFGSGLAAGRPMSFTTGASLAKDTSFAGSNPLPTVGTSTWYGAIPPPPSGVSLPASNVLRFVIHETAGEIANGTIIASLFCAGPAVNVGRLDLVYSTGGTLTLNGYTSAGSSVFTSGPVGFALDGALARVSMNLIQQGSNVEWEIETYYVGGFQGLQASGTFAGGTNLATSVVINPNAASMGGAAIGHIMYQYEWESLFDIEGGPAVDGSITGPLSAWAGEAAGNRFARLCTENNIAPRIYGFPARTVGMGAQTIDTLPNLLQSCEDADQGMLYEPRQCLGIGYRTNAAMVNQAASVTVDYPSFHIGDGSSSALGPPTDDDQWTVNDWTVTNTGGSSYEATLNDGSPMSISNPPAGAGAYSSTKTIPLYADGQLPDAAGWLLHVSTVNEERYPSVPFNLARSALSGLFYTLQNLELGDFLAITNPPAWLPPGTIKQIVLGATEQLGGLHWHISWQCIPESPYETVIANDANYGRVDQDGTSALSAGVSSGATSLSVAVTSPTGTLWTTSAGDFPFDILVAGERMTVTNITGAASPQTFTVTRSVNGVVKAQLANAAVGLFFPPILALI